MIVQIASSGGQAELDRLHKKQASLKNSIKTLSNSLAARGYLSAELSKIEKILADAAAWDNQQ